MTLAFLNPSAPTYSYILPPIHAFDLPAPPHSNHHHSHHNASSEPCAGRCWAHLTPPDSDSDHTYLDDSKELNSPQPLPLPPSSSSPSDAFSLALSPSSKRAIPSVARSAAAATARPPSSASRHSTTSSSSSHIVIPSSSSLMPVAQSTMATTFAPQPQSQSSLASSSHYGAASSSSLSLNPVPERRRSPLSHSRALHPYTYVDSRSSNSFAASSSSSSSQNNTESASSSSNGGTNGKPAMLPPLHIDTTFVPQNTGDMICYLWFATNLTPPRVATATSTSSSTSTSARNSSTSPRSGTRRPQVNVNATSSSTSTSVLVSGGKLNTSSSLATPAPSSASSPSVTPTANTPANIAAEAHRLQLQFSPSSAFITFLGTLLRTTQVSQGVIILSLHYIYRLKLRNPHIKGLEGSEFRLAVIALMLANKFLDDNTYTNKTWSDVSGIALSEINLMEREFLQGVDHALYIDFGTYQRWGKLLGGLLLAKERDKGTWRRRYAAATASFLHHHQLHQYQVQQRQQQQQQAYPSPPQTIHDQQQNRHLGLPNSNSATSPLTPATSGSNATSGTQSRADGLPIRKAHGHGNVGPKAHVPPHPSLPNAYSSSSSSPSSHADHHQYRLHHPYSNSNHHHHHHHQRITPSSSGSGSSSSHNNTHKHGRGHGHYQRTRARSSSPVSSLSSASAKVGIPPSGPHHRHHHVLPPTANHAFVQPASQQQGQQGPYHEYEYPFTFALPSHAPHVKLDQHQSRRPSTTSDAMMAVDMKMENTSTITQAPAPAWNAVVPPLQQQQRQQQQQACAGTKRIATDNDDGGNTDVDEQRSHRRSPTSPKAPNKMPKLSEHHHRDSHAVQQQLAQLSLTNPNANANVHAHGPSLPPIITSTLISGNGSGGSAVGGNIGTGTSPVDGTSSNSTLPSWARAGAYSGNSTTDNSPECSSTTSGSLFVDAASTTHVPSGTVVVPPAEPTLQRTLQAPYTLNISKWESRRAVPQYLTFNALASSPSGTLKSRSSASSTSQQLPTPSPLSNGSRAAHSYVSVPRGSRRTVVRYDEPVLPPHPRAPLPSHSEQKPLAFTWGPSATAMYHHRPLPSQDAFERDQHKFYSRQGSISAGASPATMSSDSFSSEYDDDDDDEEDDGDAMMAIDPTPTASSFNLASTNRNPKDDMVFQSYLPLPSLPSQSSSLSHSPSASTPTSAVSPVNSSHPPPPAQSIPDLNVQLAPFANAGPAGVHHWTTTSAISPQSQSQTRAHHSQYSPQYYQQQYNSRPNANNTSTGSSPLAPTWNRSQHLPPSQQWSPTAPYGIPPMGVWSEAPSPVSRGRRM